MTREQLVYALRHYGQRTRMLDMLTEEIDSLRELYEKISSQGVSEGKVNAELSQLQLQLLEKVPRQLRLKAWIARVDATLNCLTEREREVLCARTMRLMLWTEIAEYMYREYGTSFTRQGLRGIYNRAIDKMLSLAGSEAA